ncbi:MAG: ROK family protein [Opitutaceae bacterium]
MKILGIDIGGSAVKGAPVDSKTGRLLAERHRIATDRKLSPQEMAATIKQLAAHFNWTGPIGIGFPGVIHGPRITTSANLHKGFIGCDAVKLFAKATGCRVALVNDADAAGLAEVHFGAGRGITGTILLLTLGTGVGSALFCNGRLYQNSEMGHLPIRGKSAERFVSAAAKDRRKLSYKEWGKELRDYIGTLENILWPERIIIGGGVSKDYQKFFKHIKPRAKLVPAEFFNEAGIVGAALWAAEQD